MAILSHCSSLCHDTKQFLWKSIQYRLIESNANPLKQQKKKPKLLRLPSKTRKVFILPGTHVCEL